MMNIVEFVEKNIGVKLLEHQKQLLRDIEDGKINPVLIMPKDHGRTDMRILGTIAKYVLSSNPDDNAQ